MQSKSPQFVSYTPNLTITTVANKVRSISKLKRFTEPFELCGGGKTNSFFYYLSSPSRYLTKNILS
ncbi:hypothetical protein PX693_10360, partial [Streptococcus suis]